MSLIREMFSFAGWSFIGAASGVFRDHGGNILVNLFSGPAVNAARGVALQLNGAVQGFVTNFMTAVNPQITKSYAAGDHAYMFSLIRKSSRMSFYLLFILALPVVIYADDILDVWLKEVPEHSVLFVRLFLVFALSESVSSPLVTAQLATGKIRDYQLLVGGIQFLNVPVSYLFLKLGYMPESTVVVAIVISQMCLFARLFMLEKMIGLSYRQFFVRVYLNVMAVASVALPFSLSAAYMLPESPAGFLAGVISCMVISSLCVLFVGCSRDERCQIVELLKQRIR
jgi:O-antigen/teichoic acid export membrane protein